MRSSERQGKRVVVIGGAGYVGSVLTEQLLEEGYEVDVFDVLRFGKEPLRALEERPGFRLIVGDIRHLEEVSPLLPGAYGVILLAGLVGEPACDREPHGAVDINLIAPVAVAAASRYHGVPRFLFASTDSAYGVQEGVLTETSPMNPISLYARLKMEGEKQILALETDEFRPVILRMATIYGRSPRMRFDLIVNTLTLHAVSRGKVTIFGGEQWRPLVHVSDAARAYVKCLAAPLEAVGGQIFNVGSNEQNYQIKTIGALLKEACPEISIETVPRSPDLRNYYVAFDKISKILGYRVRFAVADGIGEIVQAFRNGTFADFTSARYYNVSPS